MTAINDLIGAGRVPRPGIWSRTAHALGKLWRTVLALPDASRPTALPPEYFDYPPI